MEPGSEVTLYKTFFKLSSAEHEIYTNAEIVKKCGKIRFKTQKLENPAHIPREPKVSISQKKRLEVTSPAIVVLNAFLDSSDLPKEGLSGLLWKLFWRDALIRRYLDVLFVIKLKCSTQLYYEQSYL